MIGMEKVSEFLVEYEPKVYIKSKKNSFVKDAVLLNKCDAQFKTNLLYICKASELFVFNDNSMKVNILCVSDEPIPNELLLNIQHNLIFIFGSVDLNELYIDVSEFLDSCWQLASAQVVLSEALLTGRGLQLIVDSASEIFGNPIIVFDISYKVLAYSKNIGSDDAAWKKMTEYGYCPNEMVESMIDGKLLDIYKSEFPIYVERRNFFPYNYQLSAIKVLGKVVGHASVIEFKRQIKSNEPELLKFLCEVIACEMQKDQFIIHTKGVMYENFIADLLDGKTKNRSVIEERMKYLDFLKQENFYVFTARLRPDAVLNRPLPYLRDVLEPIMSGGKSVIYDNGIVTLISRVKDSFLTKTNLLEIASIFIKYQMIGGVSNCFHKIEETKMHYLQSSKAIDLGFRLNREETIYFYDDYSIYNFIEVAENQDGGLKNFLSPLLYKLIKYDLKYQTDFTDSLYAYLSNGNNLTRAAKIFDIHRNSMNYRIKKIEEILDIDVNDTDVTFSLLFSFKLLIFSDYMNGASFAEALKKIY